ncbi:hypothetical protein HZH66_008156 [Vespula vulgaris]|uniref:Uncharacterized protein n=1 Tax=Vespula vulgaris TaxID=7454 RepID=A0A834N3J5_VESVU|nr:hypothetical protein HZH66_008156 [Vespula vulgaris]
MERKRQQSKGPTGSAAAAQIAAWQPLSPRHDSYIPLERVSAVTTTTAIHPCRRIPFPHPTSPHVHPHSPTLFSLRWFRSDSTKREHPAAMQHGNTAAGSPTSKTVLLLLVFFLGRLR